MQTQLTEVNLNNYPVLQQTGSIGRTEKYAQIPTTTPIEIIRDFGWVPHDVIEINSRFPEKQNFGKHRVRFFNPEMPEVNGSLFELLLTNSHNGSSAFQMQMGIFRMVCANGLIMGDTFQKASVRHVGFTDTKVEEAVTSIASNADRAGGSIERFSGIELEAPERAAFAEAVLNMRFKDGKFEVDPYGISSVLTPRRYEDRKSDLWTTMNVMQERVCRLGFQAKHTEKKDYRKVRAVKAMNESDRLNKAIWTLTEKMAELKEG